MDSKTALVTGSTDGVGRHVGVGLAGQGVKVLLHGRNRQRAEEVLSEIRRGGGEASFYQADFASLDAVRELAAAVRRDHPRLDLLINNAGIFTGPGGDRRSTSADGHELRFAVNFNGKQEARANPQAYDAAAREELRKLSLALTGLSRA